MATPTAEKLKFYYALKSLVGDGGSPTVHNEDVGGDDMNLISSTLTQADDYWNGAIGRFTTGALAGEYFHVKDFIAASDQLVLARPLSAAPALNDDFILFFGGNWRSDEEIPGMDASAPVNVTGVTIDYVNFENGEGNGTLTFTNATTEMQWTAPGGTIGAVVDVSLDGTYVIFDNDTSKFIIITVVAASLPGSDQTDSLALTNPEAEVLPNWEGYENAAAPKTRYHLTVIENSDGVDTMLDARAYVTESGTYSATTADETLNIAADDFEVDDATGWPTQSFWIINTTKDDVRFVTHRSGNRLYTADATGGLRGKTAQAWAISDDIEVYPEIDIGLDAPSTLQFEDPADEETAPAGVSFSAPENFTDGLQMGNLAAGDIYGIWIRETILAGAKARTLYENKVIVEWS